MKRIIQTLILIIATISLLLYAYSISEIKTENKSIELEQIYGSTNCLTIYSLENPITILPISKEELNALAMCMEAEAGNQGYLGKVYVLDCILNRFDSGNYDTYIDVIYEPKQFECVMNGTINCEPADENFYIINNEFIDRTNSDIKHFRTKMYHKFGTPCFKYGSHYFSK